MVSDMLTLIRHQNPRRSVLFYASENSAIFCFFKDLELRREARIPAFVRPATAYE